jgi:ABC-type phosphate transport system substrate-binding protein
MMKRFVLAALALGAICASEAVNAQTIIRGGGANVPAVAYRNLFDCVAFQPTGRTGNGALHVTTPLSPSCVGIGPNSLHISVLLLYAPVGSGGGKEGFVAHSAGNWAALSSGNIPMTDDTFAPTWPYADPQGIQFASSEDLLLPSDIATYKTNGGPANWGNILFMPALSYPVAISVNRAMDGNDNNWLVDPNTIKLSRKSLCGIFSGHITQWDNASIVADNAGVVGHGPITVVHDDLGRQNTNFLLTNALSMQCPTIYGTNNEGDPTLTLYAFPWTDNFAPIAQCPALPVVGSRNTNWPNTFGPGPTTDQCGNPIPNPSGATFVGVEGDQAVANEVNAIVGAIGYNTVDVVQPIAPFGPQTALLQSQYDIDNNTGLYHLPTAAGADAAMEQAIPVFNIDVDRANPLNWAAQGTVPNPVLSGAYPIAGFSWFLFYQCYARADVAKAILGYTYWHYSNGLAASVIGDNGMAVPPVNWVNQIQTLITTTSPIGFHGDGGVCNGKPGA